MNYYRVKTGDDADDLKSKIDELKGKKQSWMELGGNEIVVLYELLTWHTEGWKVFSIFFQSIFPANHSQIWINFLHRLLSIAICYLLNCVQFQRRFRINPDTENWLINIERLASEWVEVWLTPGFGLLYYFIHPSHISSTQLFDDILYKLQNIKTVIWFKNLFFMFEFVDYIRGLFIWVFSPKRRKELFSN